MAKKGMEYLVRLTAQVDKALPGEMKKMANHLKGLERQMENYKKTGENFELVKKKIKGTVEELRKVKASMQALEKAKAKDGKMTKAQEQEYARLAKRQEKLSQTLDKQRNSYKQYQYELKRQKIPMQNLREEIEKTTRAYKKLQAEQKLTSVGQNLRTKVRSAAKGIGAKAIGAVKRVAVGATVAGAAGAGYVGMASAQAYLDFNKNMKKVQAISGATAEEFKLLEKEAKRLGATTKFTAGEAAAAMEKMALAGFNTKDIIASMPGVLDLAAASGEDVAMVSDIITDNLTAFNMTAKDTGRFADVLSWGMSKTNVTVEMLGESFKYAAGSAGTLGVSLEEAVGSLGLMGDQAIKSGMAGRGLNEVFSRLVKNKDDLKKVGINIANSKGEFVGLVEVVKQFEKHTKNMKDIDKIAFLKNVFGEQGERSFSKLLSAQKTIDGITYTGAEALEKTVEAATKDSVGMAEKMKNIMLDGASGAMILLESAWDGIKIAVGDKIFSENNLKYIKTFTNYLSELANVLSGSFYDNKYNNFWKNFFTVAKSYMSKLYEALKPGIKAIQEMLPSKSDVTSKMKFIGDLILKLAEIISWLILRIQELKKVIDFLGVDNIVIFIATFMGVIKVAVAITKLISAIKLLKDAGGIILGLKSIIMGFIGVNPYVLVAAGIIAALVLIYKNWDKIKIHILNVWETVKAKTIDLWSSITNIFVNVKEHIVNTFNSIKEKIVNIFSPAIKWLKGYIESFFSTFGDLFPFAALKAFWDTWDSGKPIMENLKNGITAYIQVFSDFLPIKIVRQFFKIWSSELGIVDKIRLSFTQTFEAIKNEFIKLWNCISNIFNIIKPYIMPIFDNIKNYILNAFNSIKENIVNIFNLGINWLKENIEGFFSIFGNLLPFAALKAFWDTWDSGKPIMENLKNGITAYIQVFSDFLPIKIVRQFFKIWSSELGIVDKIRLSFTQTFEAIKESIRSVIDTITNLGDKIKELPVIKGALETFGSIKDGIANTFGFDNDSKEKVEKVSIIERIFNTSNERENIDGSHRTGLGYVPFDGYVAELHKGERVLTSDENEQYGSLFNKLVTPSNNNISNTTRNISASSNISFSPSINITVNDSKNNEGLAKVLEAKLKELENEFFKKLKELERRGMNERRTKF